MNHTKTVEVRIMKFSPYGSPITLVCEDKFHPEILVGRQTRDGWEIQAIFSFERQYLEKVGDTATVTINQ